MKRFVTLWVIGLALLGGDLFAQDRELVEKLKSALRGPVKVEKGLGEPAPCPEPPCAVLNLDFKLNRHELTPEAARHLDALGTALTEESALRNSTYRVEGFTCDLGDAEHNRRLSRQRAKAAVDHLVRNFRLQRGQFQVVGYGEERPIVPNTSEENRRKNRRVVVVNTLRAFAARVPERPEVEVRVRYVRAGQVEELAGDATLTRRDGYSVEFTPKERAYIYIFQVDATGKTEALFPREKFSKEGNPASPGRLYRVPEMGRWFYLDENKGREHIVVIAHRQKLTDPLRTCSKALGQEALMVSKGVGGTREAERNVGGIRVENGPENRPEADLEKVFVWKLSFMHQ